MRLKKNLLLTLILAISSLTLIGCGLLSSSDDYTSATTTTALTTGQIAGTVANGAPSRFARVQIKSMKDSSLLTSAIADKLGQYTANVSLDKKPYLIKAVDSKGKENFSFVKNVGTANVNQLSSLALMIASKTKPADIFKSSGQRFTSTLKTSIENNLAEAKSAIVRLLGTAYTDNVKTPIDIITTPMDPTKFNTDFDAVLDFVSVDFSASTTVANLTGLNGDVHLTSVSHTSDVTNIGTGSTSVISQEKINSVTSVTNNIAPIKSMLTSFMADASSNSSSASTLSTYFAEITGKSFSGFTKAKILEKLISLKAKIKDLSVGVSLVSTKMIDSKVAYQIKFYTNLVDGGIASNLLVNDNDMLMVQKTNDGTWKFVPNDEKVSVSSYFYYSKNETVKKFKLVFKAENHTNIANVNDQITSLKVSIPELSKTFTGASEDSFINTTEVFSYTIDSGTDHTALLGSTSETLASSLVIVFNSDDSTTTTRVITLPKKVFSNKYPDDGNFPSVSLSGHSTSYLKNGTLSFTYSKPTSFTPSFIEAKLFKGDSIDNATSVTKSIDLDMSSSTGQLRYTTLTDFTTKYILRVTAWNPEENEAFSTLWEFDPNAKEFTVDSLTGNSFYLTNALNSTRSTKAKYTFNADKTVKYDLEELDYAKIYTWSLKGGILYLGYSNGGNLLDVSIPVIIQSKTATQLVVTIQGTTQTWFTSAADRPDSNSITTEALLTISESLVAGKQMKWSTTTFINGVSQTTITTYTLKTDKTFKLEGSTVDGTWDIVGKALVLTKNYQGTSFKDSYELVSLNSTTKEYETYIRSLNTSTESIENITFSDIPAAAAPTTGGELPAVVKGKAFKFKYEYVAQGGAPYIKDEVVDVTFSSSGILSIKKNAEGIARNLGNFTKVNSEYIWTDTQYSHKYALSFKTDGSINEINVFTTADAFLGQLKEVVDTTETNASLPASISGKTIATEYVETKDGSRYQNGVKKSFTFDANGTLTEIPAFGRSIIVATTFTKKDGLYTWAITDSPYNKYTLTVDSTGAFTKLELFSGVSTIGKYGEFVKTP